MNQNTQKGYWGLKDPEIIGEHEFKKCCITNTLSITQHNLHRKTRTLITLGQNIILNCQTEYKRILQIHQFASTHMYVKRGREKEDFKNLCVKSLKDLLNKYKIKWLRDMKALCQKYNWQACFFLLQWDIEHHYVFGIADTLGVHLCNSLTHIAAAMVVVPVLIDNIQPKETRP